MMRTAKFYSVYAYDNKRYDTIQCRAGSFFVREEWVCFLLLNYVAFILPALEVYCSLLLYKE